LCRKCSHQCTTTYSGHGTDGVAQPDALRTTGFGLEDVSTRPSAPNPEPSPYYYRISATGGRLVPPKYTLTPSGGMSCGTSSMEDIIVFYLDIGVNSDFVNIPADQIPLIEKSPSVTLLAGSRSRTIPGFEPLVFSDSWRFIGSG